MTRHVRNKEVDVGYSHGSGVVFSLGTIQVLSSGRFYHSRSTHYSRMVASLDTAGTSTTTVVLRKNGVAISGASISFTSGQSGRKSVGINVSFLADSDYLTAACTVAPATAANLVVQVS